MAKRTYVPELILVTHAVKRYIQRWQLLVQPNLSPAEYALVVALLDAAIALLTALNAE